MDSPLEPVPFGSKRSERKGTAQVQESGAVPYRSDESIRSGNALDDAGSPETARALGLAERFRYWKGVSGRRYLFSAVPEDTLESLSNVVVVMAAHGPSGEPRAAWVGEIDARGRRRGRPLVPNRSQRIAAFVHFLAFSDAERQAVVEDLIGSAA
jgi:hypothetical protein